MILLSLIWEFFKVGCFAFGGAYGAIPLIRDVVLAHGWLDDNAISRMVAISESTPGPITVNMATYVGASQAGFPGALAATIAVVLPSFVVILLIMFLLKQVLDNPYVQAVLRGMTPCIIGIVLATGTELTLSNLGTESDLRTWVLTAVLAAILFGSRFLLKKKISHVRFILLAAALGMVVYGF